MGTGKRGQALWEWRSLTLVRSQAEGVLLTVEAVRMNGRVRAGGPR